MFPDLAPAREAAAPASAGWPGRSQIETTAFHLVLAGFLAAWQIVLVPTLELNADNSWHFRLAQDIAAGREIFWSGVDANRFFPDLIFAVLAFWLPFGHRYATWLYYYHVIDVLALYGSLVALAAVLFRGVQDRRMFLVLAVLALSAYLLALPFWNFWLVVAGNHGGGLPVCFLALFLLFRMASLGRIDLVGSVAFVVMVALLVVSNRLLLITFVAPLALALLLSFALAPRRAGHASRPASGTGAEPRAPYLGLLALTALAGAAGYAIWLAMDRLSWFELVARGNLPPITLDLDWLTRALTKEQAEFRTAMGTSYAWDVWVCVLLLAAAAAAGSVAFARAVRRRDLSPGERNRALFAAMTALSAVLAMAFTVTKTDDSGTWHYRYLGVTSVFAIVFFCLLPLWPGRLRLPRPVALVGTGVGLAGLLAYAASVAARSPLSPAHAEPGFAKAVAELARKIEPQGDGRKPLRGYAEYWLANDLTTRSSDLDIAVLVHDKPAFRFYNNNASAICANDRFFIAYSEFKDEPKRADLVALLGEPRLVETHWLPRHGQVSVLYYDPAVIRRRITDPSREEAARMFPDLKCGP